MTLARKLSIVADRASELWVPNMQLFVTALAPLSEVALCGAAYREVYRVDTEALTCSNCTPS